MATDKQYTTLNVPTLRFPEFSGEWGKYTLGEKGETIIGLTYSPKDVVQTDGIIVLRSSNIQNGLIDYKDIVRVQKKIKNSLITKKDDILVCARNGSARLIGKNALIEESDANHSFGAFMMIYRSPQNRFIHHLMNTKRYFSQVGENLGARINQVTTSDLNSFEFYFPTTANEINKIAAFIDLLNERIATQRKVIEKLQSLIGGIIHRVSCDGLKNGTWKMTMLSSVLSERIELNTAQYQVHSVSVTQGVINQVEYLGRSFAAKDTSNYHVVKYGDIVYTKSPTGDFPYGIVKQSYIADNVAVSPLYGVYKPNSIDLGMILHHYFLSPVNAQNYLHKLIQKGAKNTINITNQRFLENSIPLPMKSIDIEKLATLLQLYDAKLTMENNLLSVLQRQKMYLLSTMFI